ncbi:MAG: ATP-binding protein [Ktedonobacterales bacterium]
MNSMHELPTGTVTLLFTDIEGSTRLLQHLGDRYGAVLQVCRSLMRTAFQEWHGYEVDTQGDAFFVAFARATDALSAAVAVERALFAQVWPDGITLRVRIGLHTGEPERSAEGYVGLDVHRAARIMSAGHGGQVLLSQTTHALVEHAMPEDVHLDDLGGHRLKDLGPPTRLFQLVIAGLPADFPPLKTLDRSPNNLPIQPTPFIGREKDVVAVGKHLQRTSVRLLTLTGPGGVGKTRLALQVAADVSEHFRDGTWFVSLAPLQDPDLVLSTISQTLGLRETATAGQRAQADQVDQLNTFLEAKQILLVLDNFEHLQPAAVSVANLLTACPQLKILVTSREALHLRAEQEFAVPVLALPDPKHLPDVTTLSQYEAVALFIERAQAVQPEFQVTNANAPAVAEICARLDGLPLAIELAAARIKLFPPQALLTRLGQRLQFLTQSARDTPARQQTLRSTIQWSYDLLTVNEQQLFRRLAVFAGGCALPAIESISAALGEGTPTVEVDDSVASLLDKNLVKNVLQQTKVEGAEAEGAEPRLLLLETIREYGLEWLAASGELAPLRQVHAAYYLELADEAATGLKGPEYRVAVQRLEREYANLRAALQWALEPAQADSDIELAVRLGEALTGFWEVRGLYSEGRAYLESVVASSQGAPASLRARALIAAAGFAFEQGDMGPAETLSQESLALYRELGDTRGMVNSLSWLVDIASWQGAHYSVLRARKEELLALARQVGDKEALAWTLASLGGIVSILSDYSAGWALYEESLALFRELRNTLGIAFCLHGSALWLFAAQGDVAIVRAREEEARQLYGEAEHRPGQALSSWLLGWIALVQGDLSTAQALVEESLAFWQEVGSPWRAVWALALLGKIMARQGDLAAARALQEESVTLPRAFHDDWETAFCLEGLAETLAAQGEATRAARLWGAAASLRERCGVPRSPLEQVEYEPAVAAARLQLGEEAFASACAEGQATTLEQILGAPE